MLENLLVKYKSVHEELIHSFDKHVIKQLPCACTLISTDIARGEKIKWEKPHTRNMYS